MICVKALNHTFRTVRGIVHHAPSSIDFEAMLVQVVDLFTEVCSHATAARLLCPRAQIARRSLTQPPAAVWWCARRALACVQTMGSVGDFWKQALTPLPEGKTTDSNSLQTRSMTRIKVLGDLSSFGAPCPLSRPPAKPAVHSHASLLLRTSTPGSSGGVYRNGS